MKETLVVSLENSLPQDETICNLSLRIVDNGVMLSAKSPLIGNFIKQQHVEYGGVAKNGSSINEAWANLKFLRPSAQVIQALGWGAHSFSPDLFLRDPNAVGNNALRMENGDVRRNNVYLPNLLWVRVQGLEEGIELLFPGPVHAPADFVEYLSLAMEQLKNLYLKFILRPTYTATLTRRHLNG